MDIKKLQALVIDALEDVKAQDIRVYDTSHLTSLFDRIAIASGTSNRQTKALAASVRDKVKLNGGHLLGMEGENTGEWVLVDLGDMIVHIMQPTIRAYYRLEEIWGEKEVKFGAAVRISKRTASEDASAPKKTRHLTVNQASSDADAEAKKPGTTRKPAAPKTAVKTATTTAAGRKPAAKPRAPSKPVGKTIKVAATKTAVASKGAAAKKSAGPARAPAKRAPRAAAKPKPATSE
jgi:ribosome-associated protein